jgi:probable HAF family extracellular repeat protein
VGSINSAATVWNGTIPTSLTLPGQPISSATGINDFGTIVGYAGFDKGDTFASYAVVWHGTHPTDLESLSGGSSEATAINDRGEIVGYSTDKNGDTEAVIWTASNDIASAIPEPSTWAMLLIGFAGIGLMTYRRRKSAMLAV